jgi:hypothetical protein
LRIKESKCNLIELVKEIELFMVISSHSLSLVVIEEAGRPPFVLRAQTFDMLRAHDLKERRKWLMAIGIWLVAIG